MFTYPLFKTYYSEELDRTISSVLKSGAVASGPYIQQFERAIAKLVSNEYVVSTSDMSAAMFMALYLAGVKNGDEVITTAFTCMSSSSPIHAIGALPVWVDLAPGCLHMDPAKVEQAISAKTKAVILYHTAGYPANSKAIAEICESKGIVLIEDCNNALLAENKDGLCGRYGDFSIYSFYPNRLINAIEGGALVCKKQDHYLKAKKLRRFGVDPTTFRNSFGEINPQSDIPEVGWSMNMSNLHCAVGAAQVNSVIDRLTLIRKNAMLIDQYLSNVSDITVPILREGDIPAYWVYLLQVQHRDTMIKNLKSHGIHASSLHQRNDIYSGFKTQNAELPETRLVQDTIIALPVGWWLNENDIASMMDIFIEVNKSLGSKGLN